MPKFSAFTRYGHLAFSGAPSEGEKFFGAMSKLTGAAYTGADGGHVDATRYARAMGLASARLAMRHAQNQSIPGKRAEMLPTVERAFDVVPSPTETLKQRNANLKARELLSNGATIGSINAAMSAIFGSAFIRVRVPSGAQIETTPASPNALDAPGSFSDPRNVPKFFRFVNGLLPSITVDGFLTFYNPVEFAYQGLNVTGEYPNEADDGVRLRAGDVVSIGIENSFLAEKVTIISSREATPYPLATASFVRPHHEGSSIRTGPTPVWRSNRRTVMVILKEGEPTVAQYRAANAALDRCLRAVTRWSFAEIPAPYTAIEPFVVGVSRIGVSPIGDASFPI